MSCLAARLATATIVAALLVGGASPAAGDPLGDARERVTDVQRAAELATARYADAQAELAVLDDEIAAAEAAISAGRARAGALRSVVSRRAADAYKAASTSGGRDFDDLLDVARAAELRERANASDRDTLGELVALDEDLEVRGRELATAREEQAAVRDELAGEAARLESELAAAQRAQVEVEEQLRREEARRRSAAASRRAAAPSPSARPSGGGGGGSSGPILCPVPGASFVDSWGAPRPGGRRHQGVDLMAVSGAPNLAVVSGEVVMRDGATSGLGVRLFGDDGNLYYYFHLSAYAGGPRRVQAGEVVGSVGNTGDASGGPPHTHFEIHPGGGGAVNPYPAVRAAC